MSKRLLLLFFLFPFCTFAQNGNLPLNDQWMTESEAQMVKLRGFSLPAQLLRYETDTLLHVLIPNDSVAEIGGSVDVAWPCQTSFRPIIEQGHGLRHYYNRHNVGIHNKHKQRVYGPVGGWIRNYHYSASLLQVERNATGDIPLFRLYIDPLVNLTYLNTGDSGRAYINSRGVTARGDIGKVSFETSFWENQAFFPSYVDSFALTYGVIPGMGRWKRFKNDGYDYAMATGNISWGVCKYFNVQVGSGKHFIGDGVRSLLLSDNSFNYPYAKFTGWAGPNKNLQYTVMYASLMNLTSGGVTTPPGAERLFQKKSMVVHHLAYKFLRSFEVSVFQAAIYQHADSMNRQSLDFWYWNPVMFASMAKYGLKDTNNYVLGFTARADLFRRFTLYGQFVADELGQGNHAKTGWQVGLRYFDAFFIRHLHLRVEYNQVNRFTYAHEDALQSWTHYNQALAHPLGAGFSEINASLYYKFRDFFFFGNYFVANANLDSLYANGGTNIFKSDAVVNTALTTPATLTTLDVHVGWMISYASNLNLSVGYKTRKIDAAGNPATTSFVYVCLRTSLTNQSFDFF
jgi:hypothetical protein